jgi:hypothetical protein
MVFEIQGDATFKEVAGEGPGLVRLYNRVLNVPVPEVVLQGPRVVAVVGELEPTGMTKHVRVDREWHLGGLADAVDESVETDGADGPPAGQERDARRYWPIS